jgi:UDP-2,3-diacylglucosamine hydrolase
MKKYFFISDAHLGIGTPEHDLNKERRLVKFLKSIKNDAATLVIVGDLFDYWFEYKSVVPKGYVRLFGVLADFADSGVPVHFVAGNHDFWVRDYFEKELGWSVSMNSLDIVLAGKKFFIHHGDGFHPQDGPYRTIKKILRSRTNIWLYSLLHPDLASWLSRWFSGKSREYSNDRRFDSRGFEDVATKKFADGYDVVVFGHCHRALEQHIGNGVMIGLGEWLRSSNYGVFDGDTFVVKTWNDNEYPIS